MTLFAFVDAARDLGLVQMVQYLLKYDTVMSGFGQDISLEGEYLVTPNEKVKMLSIRDPEELPWNELNIDVVVEATGIFRTREKLEPHPTYSLIHY